MMRLGWWNMYGLGIVREVRGFVIIPSCVYICIYVLSTISCVTLGEWGFNR